MNGHKNPNDSHNYQYLLNWIITLKMADEILFIGHP